MVCRARLSAAFRGKERISNTIAARMPDQAGDEFELPGPVPELFRKQNDPLVDVFAAAPIPLCNCEAVRENIACSLDRRVHPGRNAHPPAENSAAVASATCDTRFCVWFSWP